MQQAGPAQRDDAEEAAEVLAPDDDAAEQQHQHAEDQHPEQHLLPGVVAADFRQLFLAVVHHVVDLPEPLAIPRFDAVVPGEADRQPEEKDEHRDPDEGVQDARPGAAAEQPREAEQRRMEQCQAGQRGEHEENRDDPVVGPLRGVVAFDLVVVHR